jgi:CRP-like cAMP-binding protein
MDLKKAEEYAARGDWKNAIVEMQRLIRLAPENLDLRGGLADFYVKAGLKARAIEVLEFAAEQWREKGQPEATAWIERKLRSIEPTYGEKRHKDLMLNLRDLANIAHATTLHRLPPNTAVIREGALGRSLFLVKKGRVKVVTHDEVGEEHLLVTLGPGELFGEGGMLTGHLRSAGVVTSEPSEIVELSDIDMRRLEQDYPGMTRTFNILYKQRMEALDELKRKSLQERRTSPRVDVQSAVRFKLVLQDPSISNQVIAGTTRQLAKQGVNITVPPSVLPLKPHELPGVPILFGMALPQDYGIVKGLGRIERYVMEERGGRTHVVSEWTAGGRADHYVPSLEERTVQIDLGVAFLQLKEEFSSALSRFLASRIYGATSW